MNFEPTADTTIVASAVEALQSGLRGETLLPGEPSYDEARAVWNAMIDRRPALVVRCRGTDDVIAAVRFAGACGLPISIRGGAHNVAGHAVADGALMIDLSLMRAVSVNPEARRARVEGGATWGDVDRATQAFGLATPGGVDLGHRRRRVDAGRRRRLAALPPWPLHRQPGFGRGRHCGRPPRHRQR